MCDLVPRHAATEVCTGDTFAIHDVRHGDSIASTRYLQATHSSRSAGAARRTPRAKKNIFFFFSSFFLFFFLFHTSTFQLLDRPWSQVSSLLAPGSCLQFLPRIGFSNPTARRFFIEFCELTLSRFPQVNLCARKSPNELIIRVRVCTRWGSNSRN